MRAPVAVTSAHTSATASCLTSARQRTVCATIAGVLGLPRCGMGVRNGASVSTRSRSAGAAAAASRSAGAPLDHRGITGEAVEHHPFRRALGLQDGQHVVVRVPVVDHQRLAGLLGYVNVRAEPVPLHLRGGVVPVVVEAGLADRAHLRQRGQLGDLGQYLVPVRGRGGDRGRLVGVDRHGRVDALTGVGNVGRPA